MSARYLPKFTSSLPVLQLKPQQFIPHPRPPPGATPILRPGRSLSPLPGSSQTIPSPAANPTTSAPSRQVRPFTSHTCAASTPLDNRPVNPMHPDESKYFTGIPYPLTPPSHTGIPLPPIQETPAEAETAPPCSTVPLPSPVSPMSPPVTPISPTGPVVQDAIVNRDNDRGIERTMGTLDPEEFSHVLTELADPEVRSSRRTVLLRLLVIEEGQEGV